MKSSLTIENVKSYLAQKSPDDVVGRPVAACGCLTAETLAWMYPGCDPSISGPSNLVAYITLGGEEVTVEFDQEVTEAANKFDRFPGKYIKPVTKQELMRYMPELFEP